MILLLKEEDTWTRAPWAKARNLWHLERYIMRLCLHKGKRRACVCVYQGRAFLYWMELWCVGIQPNMHVYDTCICMVSRYVLWVLW